MAANSATRRRLWPILLATAVNMVGCVTESICVPPPPAPASCASFEAGTGGGFHIVLSPTCGYADEDVTFTQTRTDATAKVHVPADGTATSPDFNVIPGDRFTITAAVFDDCRSILWCLAYTAAGPASECP